MNFLSHSTDDKEYLDFHLVYVAQRAKKIVDTSSFTSSNVAYYAGLFHDLGKLNPYYQKLFSGEDKNELLKKYHGYHSYYSCWLAESFLNANYTLSDEDKVRAIMLIAGHHTKLRKEPTNYIGKDNEKKNIVAPYILDNLKKFIRQTTKEQLKELPEINPLIDYTRYEEKLEPKPNEDSIEAFLECGFLFSSLLQADRGSFSDFEEKKLDSSFIFNTENLVKKDNKLSDFRSSLQNTVLKNIDVTKPIFVLNAPTGCGKTKAFLDVIKKYNPERVFYFSPLLALTDDIAKKIDDTCKNNPDTKKQILVYNNTFTNSLNEKIPENGDDIQNMPEKWNFDFEAFNEKMVIATTQRLLMTIYSNSHKDKLKLASLRDSLLIVDEVQTLPKVLLKNLISILNAMNKYLNTKTLLVSATIPFELSDLPKIGLDKNQTRQYLMERNYDIIKENFDVKKIQTGKTLIMLNTRKKAKETFEQIEHKNLFYISSGIKKEHREKILLDIKESPDSILVSTQVVEAGVDISFNSIWRQMAPVDNIIQVMGRLDRESQDKNAKLHIFDSDVANFAPYSALEFEESKKIISRVSSSMELYAELEEYYKKISTENLQQKNQEEVLQRHMDKLDFDEIWSFVKPFIGESYYDSVYIPSYDTWDKVKVELLSKEKLAIKKHAGLIAQLPVKRYKIEHMFDEQLLEKNILYPKKEHLDEIYDKQLGLDIWR